MPVFAIQRWLVSLISIALLSLGTLHSASAGIVSTANVIKAGERQALLSRVEANLAETSVAEQLMALGVEQPLIHTRLQRLTTEELVQLDQTLQSEIAGADVVGIVGAVFIVLIVLEIVGVTDIFKAV